jgi:hypothetical protein
MLQPLCRILFAPCIILFSSGLSRAGTVEKNWSRGAKATQSSLDWGGDASRAIDGNRDGNFFANSVTETQNEDKPYLDIDLGAGVAIDMIRIFNRTDCCKERLNNVFVFFSLTPFKHRLPSDLIGDPLNWTVIFGQAKDIEEITFNKTRAEGRYIRIMLSGPGILSLAEVEAVQMEEIAGPADINQSITWRGAGLRSNARGFASVEADGKLTTFRRGEEGLLHIAQDFTGDIPVPGSPQLSADASIAAVSDGNGQLFAAVIATDGTLQVAQSLLVGFRQEWTWTTMGNALKEPALAVTCGKVILAWLDNWRMHASWKTLNGTTAWSAPLDIGESISAPSIAVTNATPSGDVGLTWLTSIGKVCFTKGQCASTLQFGPVEQLSSIMFGDKPSITAYGDRFAIAIRGTDAHPWFCMQVAGANGLYAWPAFEPVRAIDAEESPVTGMVQLINFRGMMFLVAADNTNAMRYWMRLPNQLGPQSGINWCGGNIVGNGGTFLPFFNLVAVGTVNLAELTNVPAELFIMTTGNDQQIHALNFSRSVSIDLLDKYFDLTLDPYPGRQVAFELLGDLPEQVMGLVGLPADAWRGVTGKKCAGNLWLSTFLWLSPNPASTGQTNGGGCPMSVFLNGQNLSARFILHEWMHADFAQRGIGSWAGFNDNFGNTRPKLCPSGTGCGGDRCVLGSQFTGAFDDPTITRWANSMVCVDKNGRPQGGVDFYEFQSDEHAFIETATRYRWQGDELRNNAALDMANGNQQLQNRYDWIKNNYYKGVEFNGWSTSGNNGAGDRSHGFIGRPLK